MTDDEDLTIRTIVTRLTGLASNDDSIMKTATGKKSKARKLTKTSVEATIEPRTSITPVVINQSSTSDNSPTPRRLVNAVIRELKGAPDTEPRKKYGKFKSTPNASARRTKKNKKEELLPPLNIEIDDSDDSNGDLPSTSGTNVTLSAKRRRRPIPVEDLVKQVEVLKQQDDLQTPVRRTKQRLDSSTASSRPRRKIGVQDLVDTIESMKKSKESIIKSPEVPNKSAKKPKAASIQAPKSPTRPSIPATHENSAKKYRALPETPNNLFEAVSKELVEKPTVSKKKIKASESNVITTRKSSARSEEISGTILNSETASGSPKTKRTVTGSSETLKGIVGFSKSPTPSKKTPRKDVVERSGTRHETPENSIKASGMPSSGTPILSTRSSRSKAPEIASGKIARTPLQSNKKSKYPSIPEKVVEMSKSSRINVSQGNGPQRNEETEEDADTDSDYEISPKTSGRKGGKKMQEPVFCDVTPRRQTRRSQQHLTGDNPALEIATPSSTNSAAITRSARKLFLKTPQELESSTKQRVSFGRTTVMPISPAREDSNTNNSGSSPTDADSESDVESTTPSKFTRNTSKVPDADNSVIGKNDLDKEKSKKQPKTPLKITPQKDSHKKRLPTRNSSGIFFEPPSPDFNEQEDLSDAINTAIEISSQTPNKRDSSLAASPNKLDERSEQNNDNEQGELDSDEQVNTRVTDDNADHSDDNLSEHSDDGEELESEDGAVTESEDGYEDLIEQEEGEMEDNLQGTEQSNESRSEAGVQSNNRKKTTEKKAYVGIHPLKKFAVNRFRFYSGMRLDKEGTNVMLDGVATFFDDMVSHLKYFAEHAHRKRITEKDTKLFLWRQGFITEQRSFDYLVFKYMSHEHQLKMLPLPKIPRPKQLRKQ